MKMSDSDKPHCVLSEDPKNMQTDFLALMLDHAVGSIQCRYSAMILTLMNIKNV